MLLETQDYSPSKTIPAPSAPANSADLSSVDAAEATGISPRCLRWALALSLPIWAAITLTYLIVLVL